MRGHITKRGKKYCIVVDTGRDANGKRVRRWHSGYRTRKDAERALPEILQRIEHGEYVAPSKRTIADFMEEWLKAAKPTLRPNTAIKYERLVERHITARLGAVPMQKLSPAMVSEWHGSLLALGLAPATVRSIHFVLRKSLQDAVRWNYLNKNVATLVTPPTLSGQRPKMQTWSPEELRRFLVLVETDDMYAAWVLAATTGMRRGEVLGLRWRDVNLDAATLSISQTLVAPSHEFSFTEPKTASGRRTLALDHYTVECLQRHRTAQTEVRSLIGVAYELHDLVFAMPTGRPIFPRQMSKWFRDHVRASELPYIRLHDLRHTHATLAFQAGIHPKVISERLGHANIKITLDTYTHAIPAMQGDAAQRMADVIFA